MNKVFVVDRNTKAGIFIAPYPSDVLDYLADPENLLWIDFYQPNYEWIKKHFSIYNHTLSLCKDKNATAYYESAREYCYLKTLVLYPDKLTTTAQAGIVNFIVSKSYILTFHDSPIDIFDGIDIDPDGVSRILARGTDRFFAYLLDLLIGDYYRFADKLNSEQEMLEYNIFVKPEGKFEEKLFSLNRSVVKNNCLLKEQARVLKSLCKKPTRIIQSSSLHRFRKIHYAITSLTGYFDAMEKIFHNLLSAFSILHRKTYFAKTNMLIIMMLCSTVLLIGVAVAHINQPGRFGLAVCLCLVFIGIATYLGYTRSGRKHNI